MKKSNMRKKCFSKVVQLVFTLVIVLNSCVMPVRATECQTTDVLSSDMTDKITAALEFVSIQKEQYGLGEVDFETLYVGEAIEAYEYIDDKLSKMDFELYPLLSNGDIVAFAIKDEKKSSVDITTSLAEEVNSSKAIDEDCALIYDQNSCYAYTLDAVNKIYENVQTNDERGDFESDNIGDSLLESVVIESEYNIQSLDYCETPNTGLYNQSRVAVPVYYSVDVSYVSQASNSNYCWASCVACIGNYLKGKYNSGEYVARVVYGSDYNKTADTDQAMNALKTIYGVSYTYHHSVPKDDTISNSIKTLKRPLYSVWDRGTDVAHATVISGINVISGYITIMDPSSGFVSATTNGTTYTYVAVNTGNTFSLVGYAN